MVILSRPTRQFEKLNCTLLHLLYIQSVKTNRYIVIYFNVKELNNKVILTKIDKPVENIQQGKNKTNK